MAGLFSQAIVAICMSAPGTYGDACNNAVDAGTRQIGIRQEVDSAEDILVSDAQNKLGKEVTVVVTSCSFVYKAAKDKSVSFKLPTMSLCDSIQSTVSVDSYALNLGWKF